MTLRVGSLFSGIGGIELGLESTGGFETIVQVEKDKFCREVLRKHWPGAKKLPDINDVTAGDLPEVELLCGGFPCQDIASANRKGVGIEGERSSLWYEFARLIRQIRPEWVLAENVESLRWKGRGLGTVLRDLAESGYDAEWVTLPASWLGAAHRRSRIFIVAYPDDKPGLQAHPVFGALRERRQSWHDAGRCDWGQESAADRPVPASFTVGEIDGIPHRLDRTKALGNAVVPQVAEFVGEQILRAHTGTEDLE